MVVAAFAVPFVLLGLALTSPREIVPGLAAILFGRGILITDYMGLGGVGPALIHAGLLTLVICAIYRLARVRITGAAMACLFMMLGFGLFGKNLINIWGIVAGVALYARYRGETFASHINVAFFGTALAPVFSELLFGSVLPFATALPVAVMASLCIGFVLSPVAGQLFHAHLGYNLYNIGFTAGVIGSVAAAILASYGIVPEPVLIWSQGHEAVLGPFLAAYFLAMIVTGLVLDRGAPRRLRRIFAASGQAPSDFIAMAGLGATLVNMGLCGFAGLGYVLALGGDLNGPVIGALFSVVGFGAFGKHLRNILPVMAGIYLSLLLKPFGPTDPTVILAALFGTTLAPIAGRFGWGWGILAGMLHLSAAQTVGTLHGGLNLYNNGFAAGMVAAVLVPIIIAVRRSEPEDDAATLP